MKSFTIAALAAAGLATACTSETTVTQPETTAPAAAPAPAPMVEPAAGSPRRVTVMYMPPDGLPAAQHAANTYCSQHFGTATAQLMTDNPPGHATFACPGM
jgi:hypothetical protein